MNEKIPENNNPISISEPKNELNINEIKELAESIKEQEEHKKLLIATESNSPSKNMKELPITSKSESTIGNTAKAIGMSAVMASSFSGMANANEAPKNADIFPDAVEKIYEAPELSTEEMADPFNTLSSLDAEATIDPIKKTPETTEPTKENTQEHFSIDVTKSFGFEKAKLTLEQFQEAESEIINQLQLLPQETLQALETGKKVISVKVSRSPEEIIKGGYDAGRGWVLNNEELAKDTAEEGGDVIESATQKIGLSGVTLQFEIPEGGVDKTNPTRYVKISFEDVNEEPKEPSVEIINSPEIERLSRAYAVIIDRSPSMNSEASQVQKNITEINQQLNSNIKIVKLEAGTGGATEKHMLTINRVLDEITEPFQEKKYIYVYTDEPDFDSTKPYLADGKYEQKLQETIDRANSLNIEVRLKAFQPGNTMKFVDKTLESGDLTMQTKKSELDNKWFDQLNNNNSLASRE